MCVQWRQRLLNEKTRHPEIKIINKFDKEYNGTNLEHSEGEDCTVNVMENKKTMLFGLVEVEEECHSHSSFRDYSHVLH
jgi:hypothetical protein